MPKRVLAHAVAAPPPHIEIRVSGRPASAPAAAPVAAQPVTLAAASPVPAAVTVAATTAPPTAPTAAPAGLAKASAPAPAAPPRPAVLVKAVAPAPPPKPKLVSAPAPKPAAAPPRQVRLARAEPVAPKRKAEPHPRLAAAEPRKPHRVELAERIRPQTKHAARAATPALAEAAPRRAKLALAHARRADPAPARLRRLADIAPAPAPQRSSGLHKVSAARCALADPTAAMVCADPMLSAAERRLDRAYREAQAAGVPAAQLERQQQRWLAARATAARQAPWAVHDVYVARIAELQDEIRAAQNPD